MYHIKVTANISKNRFFEKYNCLINENYLSFIESHFLQPAHIVTRLIDMMQQSVNISLKDIHNVNEALLVLRHFIDLSSRLLPFLDELQTITEPTEKEEYDKQRIIEVYESYQFDTETSEILIGSNILELIKESFHTLANSKCEKHYQLAQKKLVSFILEHKRLSDKWKFVGAN